MVDENKITTAEDALRKRAQNRDPHQAGPEAGINVGFSPKGMQTVRHTPICLYLARDILMLMFIFI